MIMDAEESVENRAPPDTTDTTTEKKEKKERKRQRKLIGEVQQQLEFYFGNANLRHDRFLRREIENNKEGYIQIDVLLKFNKLKQMVGDRIDLIVKAAKNSQLIEVNEQETQIKRSTPIPTVENADAQTVYVEHLPTYTDHDWLRKVFGICGNVEYISLPRFKHNGNIKGFAFIEYSTKEEAEKACRVLNTLFASKDKHKEAEEYGQTIRSEVVSTSSEPTESHETAIDETRDLSSLEESTSSLTNLQSADLPRAGKRRRCLSESEAGDTVKRSPKKRRRSKTTSESSTEDRKNELCNQSEKKRKRKRSLSCSVTESEDDYVAISGDNLLLLESQTKKSRPKDGENAKGSKENHIDCIKSEQRLPAHQNSSETCKECKNTEENRSEKKKKKRKRKKKEKETDDVTTPPLYVISKAEWLNMKKQYKNLQRVEMKYLKGTLSLDAQESNKNEQLGKDETVLKGPKVPLQQGTVLRIASNTQELYRKDIKDSFPEGLTVAYIDLSDGASEGFIRFHKSEDSQRALKELKECKAFSLSSLTAEEESNYFQKIEADRKARFEKRNSKKERGIEKVKIKKKMEKARKKHEEELVAKKQHVFFEDS